MDWKTPKAVYQILDAEFGFNHDPCPPRYTVDGLQSSWGGLIMLIRHTGENYHYGLPKASNNGSRAKPLYS